MEILTLPADIFDESTVTVNKFISRATLTGQHCQLTICFENIREEKLKADLLNYVTVCLSVTFFFLFFITYLYFFT